MIQRHRYNPVRPITAKGKLLTGVVRALYGMRNLLGGKDWKHVMPGHHEDPRKMKFQHQLYFGHKYYYRAIVHADIDSGLEEHFHSQSQRFNPPKPEQYTPTVTLSAGGDLMPYFCITENICNNLWNENGDFFFDADIVAGNLETPLHKGRKPSFVPEVMLSNMYFNASEEMFRVFSGIGKYKGFDILSTANNHSLDQGEEGVYETLNFLKSKNILSVGTAATPEERDNFPVIEKKGIRFAFLSYTFSLNALVCPPGKEWLANHLNLNEENPDISLIVHQAKLARERGAEFIVAFLHMGCAYQPYPSKTIVENMHRICRETGIDLILGGHPHNPQPLEFLDIQDPFTGKQKQATIIYSQGDFVAYDIFKWCRLPLMMKFDISKINGAAVITNIKARLVYNRSVIRNGTVASLEFIDYRRLSQHPELLQHDPAAQKEFAELKWFADTYLLRGNLERFLG
ncbi:MAG: hypothetical protein Fur0041_17610 [Bacteroidia bacterium]